MNKVGMLTLLPVAAVLFQSCKKVVGKGPLVSQVITTGNFSALDMSISGELHYTEGATYSVEIRAQQNILNELEAVVVGTTLKIKTKKIGVNLKSHDGITVRITAPAVTKMEVSGSGNIHSDNAFKPANLTLNVSGSGSIKLSDVASASIDAEISGSGNILINTGAVAVQTLKIKGSGNIDLVGVTGETAAATISGSGNIKVFLSQSLHAKIGGSGNVFYKGTPIVTTDVSGSGSVVHL